MKKILLMIYLSLFTLLSFAQNTVMITGESRPKVNQTYNYRITSGFHGVSGTKATWKVTNGKFLNGTTTLSQDVDAMSADVIWTNAGQSGTLSYSYTNGSSSYSYTNGSSSYSGTYNVSIDSNDSGGGTGGGCDYKLVGPGSVYSGDTISYNLHVSTNDLYINSYVSWTYDENYLRRIENKPNDDYRTITFIVKYSHKDVGLNVQGKFRISSGANAYIQCQSKKSSTLKGQPAKMIPSSSAVYQGNKITYTLDIPSDMREQVVVNWQGSMLLSLLSGEGTCEAVYYAAREGNAIAKATVSYNGQSYAVEDSSVRIILDPNPSSISYNAIKNYTDISRLDRVGSLTFGSEIRGATKFQWYGGFPVEYKGSKTSASVTVDKKHIISKGFGMTIWVTASNDKESVTIYYFVSVDGVGGLDPTLE
ncbi:hypothetical protein IR148_06640 [Dysgonomonas mossii]|uniref:Uncharacterized protein n=2 Tax=Dysgonomonas mossii TaxID=163665 RepID=A0A4Y9IP70_9BACT|nr:hypothetical protein [Dysgonomonas mossii]TFU90313.1 hypothetical protein E4T88_06625 [Dysgonomonas mossii]